MILSSNYIPLLAQDCSEGHPDGVNRVLAHLCPWGQNMPTNMGEDEQPHCSPEPVVCQP